ncbi:MAG: hypothetical protein ACRDSP_18420 [Pseudonocardiaceae bacterium]
MSTTYRRAPKGPAVSNRAALVRAVDPVDHTRLAVASIAAPAQLGVKLLQHPRRNLADRLIAERGAAHNCRNPAGSFLDFVDPQQASIAARKVALVR